jgi:hypothetical protein
MRYIIRLDRNHRISSLSKFIVSIPLDPKCIEINEQLYESLSSTSLKYDGTPDNLRWSIEDYRLIDNCTGVSRDLDMLLGSYRELGKFVAEINSKFGSTYAVVEFEDGHFGTVNIYEIESLGNEEPFDTERFNESCQIIEGEFKKLKV